MSLRSQMDPLGLRIRFGRHCDRLRVVQPFVAHLKSFKLHSFRSHPSDFVIIRSFHSLITMRLQSVILLAMACTFTTAAPVILGTFPSWALKSGENAALQPIKRESIIGDSIGALLTIDPAITLTTTKRAVEIEGREGGDSPPFGTDVIASLAGGRLGKWREADDEVLDTREPVGDNVITSGGGLVRPPEVADDSEEGRLAKAAILFNITITTWQGTVADFLGGRSG